MRALFKTDNQDWDRLRLAAEIRLGLTFAASISALIISEPVSLGFLLAASTIYAVLQVRLKTIALAYLFFGMMAMAAVGFAWALGFVFEAMKNAFGAMLFAPFCRMAISVNMILPLVIYADLSGLVGAMNRLRAPGIVRLPLIVTIRFIPTFVNDLRQLREAVGLRFSGRNNGFFWLRHPLLWWRAFFMPLVVRLIRSADELAVASELKGLSSETDFGDQPPPFKRTDRATAAAGLLVIVCAGLWQVINAAG